MANISKALSIKAKKLKACRQWELLKDQFSELPDEIKVKVLSLLTMKEAGQTSVLSKRWRYVWAYVPVLNFDAYDTLYKLMLGDESLEVEKPRYLRWVNRVVGSYKGPTIDEFRVRFDLGVSSRHSIDSWVNFIMTKRVKKLELNFDPDTGGIQTRCYTLRGLSISASLTSLKLVFVNVTGKVLEKFLKSCPRLEYMSVEGSKSLVNLEVVGETLNLKYLEIILCFEIKYLEICAPNLLSCKYFGPKISVPFKSTPKLVALSVGADYGKYLTNNFSEISSSLFQLEALTLDLTLGIKFSMKSVDQFPQCKRLKQLELIIYPLEDEDLFCFAPLIKACPFLHKFVLKLKWDRPDLEREPSEVEACRHEHLKIVEIVGFAGNAIDIEFIMYLISSCVALEQIVIDLREPLLEGTPWEFEVDEKKTRAREQAMKLSIELDPKVVLIIR